jgi:DNA-binding response OmpR family regulator
VLSTYSSRKRILCVEDHPETCELIAAILTEYEVESVADIKAARRRLGEAKFSLVVLDFHLPDGDGLSFCEEVRRTDFQTPIIFITGDDSLSEAKVRMAGGQRLIQKDSLTFVDDLIAESDSLSVGVA